MKSVCLTVLLLTLTVSWTAFAADIKVAEIIKVGSGHSPRWSPDGSHILYARNLTMCVYDVDKRESRDIGELHGREYEWLSDSQIVFLENHPRDAKETASRRATTTYASVVDGYRSLMVDSSAEGIYPMPWKPHLLSDRVGSVGAITRDSVSPIVLNRSKLASRPFEAFAAVSDYPSMFRGKTRLNKDTDIWLVDVNGNRVKRVTNRGGYAEPILSPNGAHVCAWDARGGGLVVLDTEGKALDSLGRSDAYCWSYDGDEIFFAIPIEGEDDIIGGDLYYYSLDSRRVTQLTKTPDVAEMDPAISPDGKMLVYRNYGEDRGGLDILVLERSE